MSGLILEFYPKTNGRGADLFNCNDDKTACMKFDLDMELDAVEDTLKSLCTQMWKGAGWRSRNCIRIPEQWRR